MASPYALDFGSIRDMAEMWNRKDEFNRQQELARNKLAMEQERLGFERELHPLNIQATKQKIDTGQLEYQANLAKNFGGFGQALLRDINDPVATEKNMNAIKSHPQMRRMFDAHLPPGWENNPQLVGHFTTTLAGGYKDPSAEAAQAATTYAHLGQGYEAFAKGRTASPSGQAAKMLLMQKYENGETPTPEEIRAAYENEPIPPMPGMPASRTQPAAAPQRGAALQAAPSTAVAGQPGSTRENFVYAPTPQAVAQLPGGVWYHTKETAESGQSPILKPTVGAAAGEPIAPAPSSLAGAKPLTQGDRMPPGAVPGGLQARPGAPTPSMMPLSKNAQQAENLMRYYGAIGDRAGVQSAYDRLKADPTYEARNAQAQAAGKDANLIAQKQAAGAGTLEFADKIIQNARAWEAHAPKALNAATGPFNTSPALQKWTGSGGGYALWNALNHDINALTALYREMPSAGKGAGSDAQDATFNAAIGEWREARDPATMFAIMERMRDLIKAKGALNHDYSYQPTPIDDRNLKMLNKYREKKGAAEIGAGDTLAYHPSYRAPADPSSALAEARAAISRGAPEAAVIARLRERGIDPAGLAAPAAPSGPLQQVPGITVQ